MKKIGLVVAVELAALRRRYGAPEETICLPACEILKYSLYGRELFVLQSGAGEIAAAAVRGARNPSKRWKSSARSSGETGSGVTRRFRASRVTDETRHRAAVARARAIYVRSTAGRGGSPKRSHNSSRTSRRSSSVSMREIFL